MIHAISYQFSRGTRNRSGASSVLERLQPVGQAAVLALVAGAAVRMRRDPELRATGSGSQPWRRRS